MAIGVIATITIQEGKSSAFEAEFLALAAKVNANEPGCVFYSLQRSKSNPLIYKVLEQYQTAADVEVHGKTDYFKAANKVLATLVAAAPEIEVLDTVEAL
ncbi:MAG: quinol monooxygenase YgiN [Arenicella sp.]|jgi:quinol monooxygenase YgiN